MTTFTLRCLGALAVSVGTTPITNFATDKTRALLVYLALEAGAPGARLHARAELLGLLWPEVAQEAAQNSLRVTLHRLRETLDKVQPGVGNKLILSTRQTLQFNTSLATVDVLTFEALLAVCITHPHSDLQQCDDCLNRLKEAADLYGGEFLSGFALADAPAFEEWLLLRRESLHQQVLAALYQLVQAYLIRGDEAQAHHYASRQLALDPTREEAHRQLMRILARRGLRSEALAQYESCRHILQSELGVEPDLSTVAIYEQIRSAQSDKVTGWQGDKVVESAEVALSPPQPWSEAPETGEVYGREREQTQLQRWLTEEACRVVGVLGIGGVGKTTLAAATVKRVASHFERVLWRSLLNAPPLDELLRDILQRLADERLPELPTDLDAQLALLFDFLHRQRTLLVLDNLESILQPDQPGQMRPGYAGYAQLLQGMVERNHRSCLLLTSRERPQGIARWEEDSPLIRTLPLDGLSASAGQAMLSARGLTGATADATALVARYSGNPLALKLVAQTVYELFGGDISAFLAVDAPIFDDVRTVLDQQFARLSPLEQELLIWLAVERVPATAVTLRANLVQPPPMPRFLEALRALQRRSLLENSGTSFTLQNVVIEYLTERLIEQVCAEIGDDKVTGWQGDKVTSTSSVTPSPPHPLTLSWLNRYALLKAQATEYIRQTQVRLILQPVAERLLAHLGQPRLATQIGQLLAWLRQVAPLAPGYAGGNLLNLLLTMGLEVSNYDFSNLCVWQAYLRDAYLPRLQLVGADLRDTAFAQRIGSVHGLYFGDDQELRVIGLKEDLLGLWRARTGELIQRITMDAHTFQTAFVRSDGRLLAQLTTQRTIDLVDVPTDRLLHTLVGDPSPIWRVSFSPDGHYVASGHASGQVCIWELASGRLCHQWQAQRASVTALAFAPDNVRLAVGAVDGSLALWQATTATLLHTLPGHTDEVANLLFSPDGTTLITGSHDLTVRLWESASGALQGLLQGHTNLVRHLAIAPNGQWLATGGVDNFVYLWNLQTKKVHYMLADHAAPVERLTFSPDNQTLAAHDASETISVWAVASGQRLNSYRLHLAAIQEMAFSSDGGKSISGCVNAMVYRWDVSQPTHTRLPTHAQVTARLVDQRYRAHSVAFSPDESQIATADFAGSLRLWYRPTRPTASWSSRQLLDTQTAISQIAFSPDGQLLAICSDDGLRLWSLAQGRQLRLLQGVTIPTRICAFSPDGRWLASDHPGYTISLWSLTEPTGIVLRHTLDQHTNLVGALLFSPDSRTLFSAGFDDTLRRWEVASGTLQASWSTQGTVYTALAIQSDGRRIASGSSDHAIRFLDSESGEIASIWHGHTHTVEALRFSSDGQLLVSASRDETIRLWDVATGVCLQTLRAPGPYAGMNISGVTGISAAQKTALKALGAVEDGVDKELALSNAEGTRRQEDKETRRQGERESGETLSAEIQVSLSSPDLVNLREQLITTTTLPHNLPTQITPFVGRSEELAAILQQLATPSVRLLTLQGAGGMGKTRLALETAKRILDSDTPSNPKSKIPHPEFPDGLFFVSLASTRQTSELAIAVAAAVGLNLTSGDPQQMVIRFLQPKRLLLILDNFEHLLVSNATGQPDRESSAVQFVAELLQAALNMKILATSREKLHLQSEQIYPIHGMELADTMTLASAEAATAVQLFVQSARRVQPGFVLTTKNLPALVGICQLVEGMPLGIEMAVAWVEMLTLEEIAAEIAGSLDFLAVDWPELPARQRSMRGVFEWSWNLLNDSERQVLRQLAIFRGGFTRLAAEQVAGASLRVLTSLMQKSLLRRSTSSGEANTVRYELHELLRQFAAEQLATQPAEQQAVAQRHSAFYLALVATRERRLARNELKEAASEIQSELDNVRKAWLAAVQQDAWSELSAVAYALRLFYTFTSLEPEGEQLFQLAIERLRLSSAPPSQRLRSKLLGFQAILQIAQLKHQEAMAAAQEAMAINAALTPDQRDAEGETFGPLALGMVLALKSSGQKARTLLEQALTLAQQQQAALSRGEPPIESLYDADWAARISLRDLDRYADNYPGAVAHVQQAVELCRALGKTRGEMVCLIHLADPLIKVHDYAAARQECAQGLALARALRNRWGEAFSLHHLGNATRLLGYYGEAQRLLENGYTIIQADSDISQEAMAAALLGHLHNLMGASDQAHSWFERFLALLQQFHEPWDEAEIEGILPLALFYLQQGEHGQALRYATRGLQIAQRYGWRQNQVQALLLCGQAQMGLQLLAAAATSYQQAVALCQELHDLYLEAEVQAALAQLALQQGELPQAQALVATILPVLERHPQAGLDEPFAIYLTCYRVLAAAGDPRAVTILHQGYALLQQYASQIFDDSLRRSFLENVPVHLALQQAVRGTLGTTER